VDSESVFALLTPARRFEHTTQPGRMQVPAFFVSWGILKKYSGWIGDSAEYTVAIPFTLMKNGKFGESPG
jgi:hypothetical protein